MKNLFGKDKEPASVGASSRNPWPLEKTDLGYDAATLKDAILRDPGHPLHEPYLKNTHPLHDRAVREVTRLTEIVVAERGVPDKTVTVNARAEVYDFGNSHHAPFSRRR